MKRNLVRADNRAASLEWHRKLISSASAVILALTIACGSSVGQAHAAPIQLGAEHDEVLQPLPPQFQAGAESDDTLPAQQRIEWFPVPNWMAGTWSKQGDTEDSAVNLQTGQQLGQPVFIPNANSLSFGHQVDAKGTVWHAEILPFRTDGFGGKTEDRRYVTQMQCITNNIQQVVLRTRSFVTSIDIKKRKVRGSKQQDEIIAFQPMDPQHVETVSSTRSYSAQGQALVQSRSHTTRTRTAPFVPIPALNGIDLRRSLAEYFQQHNWAYLIPQQQQ